ncbi:Zinc finger A20 and AN1 domain stress-associated protein [Melia azedarach]|nr:Zinc finger A20 and AN1 domain stress-associated protein [Melia azedarach]
MNLCSKCYGDLYLKEQQQASIKSSVENSLSASPSSTSTPFVGSLPDPLSLTQPDVAGKKEADVAVAAEQQQQQQPQMQPNRCSVCRKRIGLTGFKCRCGTSFCGTHRYPEKHGCTFDFKKFGREEIARANPLIKAEKLEKI